MMMSHRHEWGAWQVLSLLVPTIIALSARPAAAQLSCVLNPDHQPVDPLQLQTVITSQDLAKTIKVEKEVFDCADSSGLAITRELNIYTEIIENLRRPQTPPMKTFEVIVCDKRFDNSGGLLLPSCATTTPPPRPNAIVNKCELAGPPHLALTAVASTPGSSIPTPGDLFPFPPNPFGGQFVKSVQVEKEVFNCILEQAGTAGFPVIQDVNIFTEVIEDLRPLLLVPPVPPKVRKSVEIGICLKDPSNGDVIGCDISPVPIGPGPIGGGGCGVTSGDPNVGNAVCGGQCPLEFPFCEWVPGTTTGRCTCVDHKCGQAGLACTNNPCPSQALTCTSTAIGGCSCQ